MPNVSALLENGEMVPGACVGATLMFGLSSNTEQPMQILAFINFPAHLTTHEVMGLWREET